jgi:rubrerythrin
MKSNRRDFIKVTGLSLTGLGLMIGCSVRKPEKTIANLKAAITEEGPFPDRYYKYALKAAEDKFDKIAVMFTAIAKAEVIQGVNIKRVLDKLGVKFEPPIVDYEANSTLENLLVSYRSESYDVQVLYPDFIEDAETENVPDALESFTWAMESDNQHMGYYFVALTAFATKSELSLPAKWYVCPKCAGTFAEADVKDNCMFCKTPKSQFFEFK